LELVPWDRRCSKCVIWMYRWFGALCINSVLSFSGVRLWGLLL
jgi:hypothetical protein